MGPAAAPAARGLANSRWYGVAYFSFNSLKTLHHTFGVQLFLHAHRLPLEWFYVGQAVLAAWNAVDDSLMAYLAHRAHRGPTAALRHVCAYELGAPLIAVAFLFPLVPWGSHPTVAGLHHCFAVCAWDAAISYLNVSHQALGTDISGDLAVRAACKRYEIVALVATSGVVYLASQVWDADHIEAFRAFCVGFAAIAASAMLLAGRQLRKGLQPVTAGPVRGIQRHDSAASLDAAEPVPADGTAQTSTWGVLRDAARNRNFVIWVLMQFCVYCNTVFQTKFMMTFSERLFAGTWAEARHGAVLGVGNVVRGAISFMVVLPAVEWLGLHRLFRLGCIVQLTVGVLGFATVRVSGAAMPIAFVANVILTSHKVVVGMFIGDLTDEDRVVNRRPRDRSSSATFFAVRSFFTVWAESFVPMATVWLLVRAGADPQGGNKVGEGGEECMTVLWWAVPFVCGAVQLALLQGFTLHGEYLASIRARRDALDAGEPQPIDRQSPKAAACTTAPVELAAVPAKPAGAGGVRTRAAAARAARAARDTGGA